MNEPISNGDLHYKDQVRNAGPDRYKKRNSSKSSNSGRSNVHRSKNTVSSVTGATATTNDAAVHQQHNDGANDRSTNDATQHIAANIPVAHVVQSEDSFVRVLQNRNWIILSLACLLIIAIVIGSVCGTGSCSRGGDGGQSTPSEETVKEKAPQFATNAPSKDTLQSQTKSPIPSTKNSTTSVSTSPPTSLPTRAPGANAGRSTILAAFINFITLSSFAISYPPVNSTAEELALQWLIETDPIAWDASNPDQQLRLQQRYSLLTLLLSLAGPDGLFPDEDECNWAGVACDQDHNLESIDVYDNNLAGRLSADLGLLSNLVTFSVSMNDLTGTLPSSIGMWNKLMTFSVWGNSLTGTIPENIANWPNITGAFFYDNDFDGSVPTGICPYFKPLTDDDRLVADDGMACDCCTGFA